MPKEKVPGPDGLPEVLYKEYWNILEQTLIRIHFKQKTKEKGRLPPNMDSANYSPANTR